jgi:hypothetical protein
MRASFYLGPRHVLIQSFLSGLLGRLGLSYRQPPSRLTVLSYPPARIVVG